MAIDLKPIIGITPSFDLDKKNYFLSVDNISAIKRTGGISIILSYTSSEKIEILANKIDGLYLTGGGDIAPTLYNQEPHPKLGDVSPFRDVFEYLMTKKMLQLNKPILGVCRGCQILNVACGGSMYQDIYSQFEGQLLQHEQKAPVWHGTHFVRIKEGSLLYKLIGTTKIRVNSRHHQAIHNIGKHLKVCARASDDVTESIEGVDSQFVLGLQWHPENMLTNDDKIAYKIYEGFIKACLN